MSHVGARIAAAGAVTLLVGCGGGLSVSTDYDPGTDFSAYRTYTWIPDHTNAGSAGQAVDQLTDRRIRTAIEAELNSKGLSAAQSGGDIGVGYQLTTQDNVSYQTLSTGWGGGGYRWGGWGGGMAMGTQTTQEIHTTEGTLVIAIFDEGSKNLVWQGNGQSEIRESQSPEERQQRISEVVGQIMADFPPGSGS